MKKIGIIIFCLTLILVCIICTDKRANADNNVKAEVTNNAIDITLTGISLELSNAVYIRVEANKINVANPQDVKLLTFKGTAPSTYSVTAPNCEVYNAIIEGEKLVFKYYNLTPNDMTTMIYACAYYVENNVEYYSKPQQLSVLRYVSIAKNNPSSSPQLLALLDSMLVYGANSQLYTEYKTDFLATDQFVSVKAVNGTFDGLVKSTIAKLNSEVTLTADTDTENMIFDHWENSNNENVSSSRVFTTNAINETYTAVFVNRFSEEYSVVFKDYDGTILSSQTVKKGESAVAPAQPSRVGYNFIGWDKGFSNVSSDLIVFALYEVVDTTPKIIVETVYTNAGASCQVKISVCNNPGIAGGRITVNFDNRLALTNAVRGDAFTTLDYTKPGKYENNCNFSWDSLDGQNTENGAIVILYFDVSSDVNVGDELVINCSYRDGDFYNQDLDDVTLSIVNGKIVII